MQGFVTASTITDIFYLTRRALHSTEETYKVVGHILNLVKVLTVTNDDVLTAFQARANDFEDCLLATCAKSNKCDGIVTRNKKTFSLLVSRCIHLRNSWICSQRNEHPLAAAKSSFRRWKEPIG